MTILKLKQGDCLEVLKKAPDNYADSLVTDPPAGISFMGKDWDDDKGGRGQWVAWLTDVAKECLRVLKPGAHGLVWAIPRTSHWTMSAFEDAGFEVRDVITHLFGTGFPKSLDVSKAIDKAAGAERPQILVPTKPGNHKGQAGDIALGASGMPDISEPVTVSAKQWQGWGTALKPACEFWILVRKPLGEKTVAANVLKHGTGGINIDASRVATDEKLSIVSGKLMNGLTGGKGAGGTVCEQRAAGRFPANLVLDEEAAAALDEQSGISTSKSGMRGLTGRHDANSPETIRLKPHTNGVRGHDDSGGASRFFYVAKASKSDKGEGNTHPTVKNTELMRYLITLVTPPQGVVLDPFMGSGSTGVAAIRNGFGFVGIERETEYFTIAENRIKAERKDDGTP